MSARFHDQPVNLVFPEQIRINAEARGSNVAAFPFRGDRRSLACAQQLLIREKSFARASSCALMIAGIMRFGANGGGNGSPRCFVEKKMKQKKKTKQTRSEHPGSRAKRTLYGRVMSRAGKLILPLTRRGNCAVAFGTLIHRRRETAVSFVHYTTYRSTAVPELFFIPSFRLIYSTFLVQRARPGSHRSFLLFLPLSPLPPAIITFYSLVRSTRSSR